MPWWRGAQELHKCVCLSLDSQGVLASLGETAPIVFVTVMSAVNMWWISCIHRRNAYPSVCTCQPVYVSMLRSESCIYVGLPLLDNLCTIQTSSVSTLLYGEASAGNSCTSNLFGLSMQSAKVDGWQSNWNELRWTCDQETCHWQCKCFLSEQAEEDRHMALSCTAQPEIYCSSKSEGLLIGEVTGQVPFYCYRRQYLPVLYFLLVWCPELVERVKSCSWSACFGCEFSFSPWTLDAWCSAWSKEFMSLSNLMLA